MRGAPLARSASTAPTYSFGVAGAGGNSLAGTVVQCVSNLKQRLGSSKVPHFCQLFVRSDPDVAETAALAPAVRASLLMLVKP